MSITLLGAADAVAIQNHSAGLFGYTEYEKDGLGLFPQWLSIIDRHLKDLTSFPPDESERSGAQICASKRLTDGCSLQQWLAFLQGLRNKKTEEQIRQVNRFANEQAYVLDMENYGVADYWATPREFLLNNGDCEDYAIIKMLSMKWLGYDVNRMRVVVVQDTNLRTAHAVMSIEYNDHTYILDNQIAEVLQQNEIFHYVPVYSVNENHWWMHVPAE